MELIQPSVKSAADCKILTVATVGGNYVTNTHYSLTEGLALVFTVTIQAEIRHRETKLIKTFS